MPDNPHAATRITAIRQTPAEKEALHRLAAAEGVTVTEFVRDAIDAATVKRSSIVRRTIDPDDARGFRDAYCR